MNWAWLCRIGLHRWEYLFHDRGWSLAHDKEGIRTCKRCGREQRFVLDMYGNDFEDVEKNDGQESQGTNH